MLQVALLGAGRIGRVHAANIHHHPESKLHSVVDIDREAANSVAARYGARVRQLQEVMDDPAIGAALIASATDSHADLVEIAAKHGKAVLCEKPIDLDSGRAAQCLARIAESDVPLMMGFNRRFDPQFQALRQAYRSGKVGKAEVLHIISRDPAPPSSDYINVSGGLFHDMSIHDLDMARFVIDEEVIAVAAMGTTLVNPDVASAKDVDTAVITLQFTSGALGVISNSRRTTYGYDQRIELHGSKGMLQVGNVTESTLTLTNDAGATSAKPEYFFLERYAEAYAAEWDYFVQTVLSGQKPSVTGEDGAKALLLADAALLALRTGQRQAIEY